MANIFRDIRAALSAHDSLRYLVGVLLLIIILLGWYGWEKHQQTQTDDQIVVASAAKVTAANKEKDNLTAQVATLTNELQSAKAAGTCEGVSAKEVQSIVSKSCQGQPVAVYSKKSAPSAPVALATQRAVTPSAGPVATGQTGQGTVRYLNPLTGIITEKIVNSSADAIAWAKTQEEACTAELLARPGANKDASCKGLHKM